MRLRGLPILLFLLVAMVPRTGWARQAVLALESGTGRVAAGSSMAWLQDPPGRLTIDDVLRPEVAATFEQAGSDILTAGITKSAFWGRLDLRNLDPETTPSWILTLDYPPLDSVSLFVRDETGQWISQVSGDARPFVERAIPHYYFAFRLALPDTLVHTVYLRVRTGGSVVIGSHLESERTFVESTQVGSLGFGLFVGALLIMLFYNLFVYFSLGDRSYLAYVLVILNNLVLQLCYSGHVSQYLFPHAPELANRLLPISVAAMPLAAVFFTTTFLDTRRYTPRMHRVLWAVGAFGAVNIAIALFFSPSVAGIPNSMNMSLLLVVVVAAGVLNLRAGNKSARFFLLAWTFLVIAGAVVTLRSFGIHMPAYFSRNGSMIASLFEVSLFAIALADKYQLFRREKDAAVSEILKLKENANRELEIKVTERTAELAESLDTLRRTQDQLIQQEKLASLGELTAGIAHEIQNPLNFANNFSEVSVELVSEAREELELGNMDEVRALLDDLSDNMERIVHNGKRASGIVKSMLQHSSAAPGERAMMDLNRLVDEYVQLAIHGQQSKFPGTDVEVATTFGQDIPPVMMVGKDIGRVLLNLIGNAFYTVARRRENEEGFVPRIEVSTAVENGFAVVYVRDNGEGMPDEVLGRIFQPFFTTKPTGQGTGLGLSLSYDIVTKGHAGSLTADSTVGQGSVFVVRLPIGRAVSSSPQ